MKIYIFKYMYIKIVEILLPLIQFILIFLHFYNLNIFKVSIIIDNFYLNLIGNIFLIFGILILLKSIYDLGLNISPFIKPRSNSNLIKKGIYSKLRHPMYFSLLIVSFSIFLKNISLYYFALLTALIFVLKFKIKLEEKYLLKRFKTYQKYREKVKY